MIAIELTTELRVLCPKQSGLIFLGAGIYGTPMALHVC